MQATPPSSIHYPFLTLAFPNSLFHLVFVVCSLFSRAARMQSFPSSISFTLSSRVPKLSSHLIFTLFVFLTGSKDAIVVRCALLHHSFALSHSRLPELSFTLFFPCSFSYRRQGCSHPPWYTSSTTTTSPSVSSYTATTLAAPAPAKTSTSS